MIVYVVVHRGVEGYCVEGVFTDEDKAQRLARNFRYSTGDTFDVEPVELED